MPVTLMMHKFWGVADPNTAMLQMAMFMKNVAILGGVLTLLHAGPGPYSFDSRIERKRRNRRKIPWTD